MVPLPALAGFPASKVGGRQRESPRPFQLTPPRTPVIWESPDLCSMWSPPFQLRVRAIYLLPFRNLNVFLQTLNPPGDQQEPQAGSLSLLFLPSPSPIQSTFHSGAKLQMQRRCHSETSKSAKTSP